MDTTNMQNQQTALQSWDSLIDHQLIENRFVSQIIKAGDHITLNFTARGAAALIQGIKNIVNESRPKPNTTVLDGLIPKKEVMLRLNISHVTLDNWRKEGILVPVKIGRKVFYRAEDVDIVRK